MITIWKTNILLAALCIAGLAPLPAHANNYFSVGAEGFRDRYEEPDLLVDTHSNYGALTAGYTYLDSPSQIFGTVEGRASLGSDHYKSPSGTSNGDRQYEFETRLRGGFLVAFGGGTLSPYAGLGARLYYDQGKGTVTNLGFYGYDRRILQFYVPIGLGYQFPIGSWTLAPNVEYDALLKGKVNTRLQPLVGYNITNTQDSGGGWRGELMAGRQLDKDLWMQVGPFVRYWNIKDSNIVTAPDGSNVGWMEPKNTRLQYGLAVRLLF